MSFLPQDYTSPKSFNNYMKLQEGENKIRILSRPIIGWEDWLNNKPIRFRMSEKPAKPVDAKKPIKHFWAFVVWNYAEEQIQILHLTQASVRNFIESLSKDQDWGAPFFYDLKIIKTGEGVDTKYMVNPLPHKPVSNEIKEAFHERRCLLDAIFENEDPFSREWGSHTEGVFEQETQKSNNATVLTIDKEAAKELDGIFKACDPKYVTQVMVTLKKANNISSIDKLPVALYERVKTAALKNREEYNKNLFAEVA